MAKPRYAQSPVTHGVRRRRNTQPTSRRTSSNSSVIEYSCLGTVVTTDVNGRAAPRRLYIPGYSATIANSVGPSVVSYYSTAKFLPGTKIRWEPSVSFNTTGRVYVGFTDNPEVMVAFNTIATVADWVNQVKGLGDLESFPIWQETEITVPTKLRRKMFDTNQNVVNTSTDVLDRCCQIYMVAAVEGAPVAAEIDVGSFWYHDKLTVEGLQPSIT